MRLSRHGWLCSDKQWHQHLHATSKSAYSAVAQKCPKYIPFIYLVCIWIYLQGKFISWVNFSLQIFGCIGKNVDIFGMYRCYRYIQAKYIPNISTFFPIHPENFQRKNEPRYIFTLQIYPDTYQIYISPIHRTLLGCSAVSGLYISGMYLDIFAR